MERVELLAPAGNYETLTGVINAGADAVYLAGNKFGARAYADNFTDEELIRALHYAHLFHKKIYLTLNTLIKEDEMDQIYSFLLPLYQNGLDGIIVQDLGVFQYLKVQFPELPLHISTQLSAASHEAILQLKELGAQRIVPARELSLEEIELIREKTNIELETFIHGAICYCYSGQCLFSSILGGRSGNRGRCAQPCRLPYRYQNSDGYYLSMKDMCTVELIPELIKAGISSFKIEGRMKSSEYAAGVTAIYRKYIDQYYESGKVKITDEDYHILTKLYVRKDLSKGYYKIRNGREMLTITEPCYQGNDEFILDHIRNQFLTGEKKRIISGRMIVKEGEKLSFTVTDTITDQQVTIIGAEVEQAKNNPVSSESLIKQLRKTGQTFFEFSDIICDIEGQCFCQIKEINEIRRQAIEELQKKLLFIYHRNEVQKIIQNDCFEGAAPEQKGLSVEVMNENQLQAVMQNEDVARIYLDYELFMQESILWDQYLKNSKKECYIALPHILREDKMNRFDQIVKRISQYQTNISGVLARDLGEIRRVRKTLPSIRVITDSNLYVWNHQANSIFHKELCDEVTLPYELNEKELRNESPMNQEFIIYSHIPLMVTANCIRKTNKQCDGKSAFSFLEDRYHKSMPVKSYCTQCYNVIYNSVPYSLLSKIEKIKKVPANRYRIVLLDENREQTKEILTQWTEHIQITNQNQFTNGHFTRGVQ